MILCNRTLRCDGQDKLRREFNNVQCKAELCVKIRDQNLWKMLLD